MPDTLMPLPQSIADVAPTGNSGNVRADIPPALTVLLADVLALWVETKNFHWHVYGPHFRDYHALFDEQADALLAMVDPLAERARKLGGAALKSIGQIARLQQVSDSDAYAVTPEDMLAELHDDTDHLVRHMRALHDLCDAQRDVATASLLENWIDEAEGRRWFLREMSR